jgi:hypothetical protein
MNFIVLATAYLMVAKVFSPSRIIDMLISLFIFYFTQIILSQLVLGIAGILYLKNVIIFNLAIFLIVWLATFRMPSRGWVIDKQSIYNYLRLNKTVLFCICVILGFGLVKVFINLLNPPFGWDCLNYHFVFPVEWLKHGNLDTPITISDDPSPSYYPINGSLFFLWLMLPLRNVFLADLGQVPFFVLGFLSVYAICKGAGIHRIYSFFAAVLFSLIPNYFKQLELGYIDIMVAALFLASFKFLLDLYKDFSLKPLILFSLSLGLLLGTKTVALPYTGILLFFFLLSFLRLKNPFRYSGYILLWFILIFLCGGYTYIRNLLQTGNPLYPLHLKIFGCTVLKGVMDKAIYNVHFSPHDFRISKLLFHEGLGAAVLIILTPGVFLSSIYLLKKKCFSIEKITIVVLPFLLFFAYRYIISLPNSRYLYAFLGAGFVSSFFLIDKLKIPARLFKPLIIILTLTSVAEVASYNELVVALLMTAILFIAIPFASRLSFDKTIIISFTCLVLFIGLWFLNKDYNKNEFRRYADTVKYSGFWPEAIEAWRWLNKSTISDNIAYVGRPVSLPLYGSRFKNNVYYVSVNKIEPAKLHYFPYAKYSWGYNFESLHKNLRQKGNYRQNADYNTWLKNLLAKDTDFLFVYSLHQTEKIIFPIEDRWASAHKERFKLGFRNNMVHIYKLAR